MHIDPDAPLRWGIIGTGGLAEQVARDLVTLPSDASLHAVVSRRQATADAFAARFGCPTALTSVEQLADAGVDVVWVTSPHTEHARATAHLLERGIPVLCEKPMTTSPDDTRALIALAERHDTFLMEAVWMRCHPLIRHALALAASGEIGDIVHARASFAMAFDVPDDHRLRAPDLGVYPVHLIEAFLGRPSSVYARGSFAGTGVDAMTTAVFDVPATTDRPAAQGVAFAAIEAASDHTAEIIGTNGRLLIGPFFLNPESLRIVRPGRPDEECVTATIGYGYVHEIREVTRCIRMGLSSSPLVSWTSSANAADMLHAWRAALDDPLGLVTI